MKILLIDDHDLFRDGIKLVLTNLEPDTEILSANSYESALPMMVENQDFDMVLLDLGLPGLSDIDALKSVRQTLPTTPVVIVSGNHNGEKVQEILNLGAQGYIPKSTSADLLINALKLVLSGGVYIPQEILSLFNQTTSSLDNINTTVSPLTPRQNDVLERLIHGLSNKEIAKILGMAEPTVRVHIAAILKELNVTNRTRAAHLAVQKGWVTA